MRLVLLSGGSGKRLWPLSNDFRSKQFLKILPNSSGQLESMVQRVWRQLEATGLAQQTYVATSANQVEMIRTQLPEHLPIIVEPERRDTFPAIALAAIYLYSIAGAGLDETVAVLPVDPFVDEPFFHCVRKLDEVLNTTGADLALIGIQPTYPSEKYGYIVPSYDNDKRSAYEVSRFVEKPDVKIAEQLIKQQAMWNGGVFAFKLNYLVSLLQDKHLPIQYDELVKQYARLKSISFDYEVVEKAKRTVVVPYAGQWKDMGTWNTLTEEIGSNVIGRGQICSQSNNSHLINELEIPVTILGLSNVIVATSPDGILVADKAASYKVKDMLAHAWSRPMYEERRWGWYKVTDFIRKADGTEVLTKRIRMQAGKNSSYQYHSQRKEVWTITSGEGEAIIQGKRISLQEGDVLQVPAGTMHALRAISEMELIEVQVGRELVEEDVVRLTDHWDEIMQPSAHL